MKRVLALMLSSAMICTAVPGQVFAAEETLEVVNEFSDESDENDSVEVEDQELEESDIDEDTSNTDEEISEIDLQEGENSQQDLDIESGNNEDELFSDGENDAVFVKSGDVSDDIKWELDDSDDDGLEDTLIISGNGDMPDYTSYEEAPWYAYRKTISHLIIKDGITSIGSYSFLFENLENIEWGDNITRIGNHTLDDCKKMTELNLPSNLVSIGSCTFGGWTALTSVEIPNNVKTIGNEAFQECENLVSVKFSNKIEEIGNAVFLNCKKVKTVFLPTSIKKIGRSFFYGRKKFDYYQSYSGCLLSTIHYAGTKEDMLKIDGINEEELRQDGPVPLKVYFHYIVYHAPKNATCSKKGFVGYWICNNCGGKIYADAECTQELSEIPSSPALGHDLDNGVVNKEATCAEEGSILYSCQREGCDYTETRIIPKTQNHVYGDPSYTWSNDNKECTGRVYCTICGNENSETIKTQETIIQPATCTEDGLLQYTATFSKGYFKEQQKQKKIDALNHKNTEVRNKVDATCKANGYSGDVYCTDCGALLSKGNTIASTDHVWNNGTITKEPNCIETGEKTYTCTVCGKIKREEIPAVGHIEIKDEAVDPTCEEPGLTEGSHCSVCGVVIKKQEEIPATGHKEVKDAAVEPTCEIPGKTEGIHCENCGKVLKEQEEIPATGHRYSLGYTIKEPTCIETGEKTYTCTVCGKIKREEIPAVGHIEIKDEAVDPTCEEPGLTEGSHCSVCGVVIKKQEEIPALGHKFTKKKVVSQATVFRAARQEYECTTCGFKEIRNVGNKLKATIKVSTSKIIMKPQQKVTSLKVTFTKGDSVTSWKTSNSKVVKVAGKSKGTCTLTAGKIGGTATLTIKLKSGLSKKVSVIVNVKTQKITGISSKITLVKGQYITIKPKLYPATSTDKITFKSNNNTVSVNSSGKIYARKKGTAVITVKSGNKTVKSQITVEDPKISKTAISLNIGKKYTLKVTGTKQKITWSSSDKSVATVSSKGVVTAKKGGSAKITAKVLGKSYVCTVTVKGNTVNTILTVDKKKLTMSGSTIIKITSRTGGALRWETNKNNIVTCKWGEWSKNQNGWAIKLYVNAQTIGSDTITILDKDSRQKVKIPVNVKKVSKSFYSDEEKMAGYAMGFLLDYFKNRSSLAITHVGYLVNQYGKSVVMIDYKAKNSYGNYVYKNITVGIEDNLSATSHGFQIGVSDWPNKYLMVIRNSSPRYKEFTNMLDTDRVIDFINQYGSIYYSNVEVPYYNSFWVEKDWYLNEFDFG